MLNVSIIAHRGALQKLVRLESREFRKMS